MDGTYQRTMPSYLAGVNLPVAAFAGVRTRRIMAFCVDFILVSIVATLLFSGLMVLTFGLSLLLLPPLWPFVAFFYNGLSVSGRHMATPGMRMVDLEMRETDGRPVGFVVAGVHAALLYASWLFWLFPINLGATLVMPDKRCLHDLFAGVVVVRRP